MKKVLITGAAGNLGGLLANHIKDDAILHLMYHKKPIELALQAHKNVITFQADLANKNSIINACRDIDVIVHFAGVLFKSNPEEFLPTTNTLYFQNLIDAAKETKVKKIILISFPHVEGESYPETPAKGILNGKPISVHAQTRLEEEKILFKQDPQSITPISLRVGMVYGKGILMIDAAKWFAKYHLLGIWRKPTWIHLISTHDFLESTKNAIFKDSVSGIYHLGDDGVQTLQEFLDEATKYWGYSKPIRMNVKLILFAASLCEFFSSILKTKSPLTKDFIRIGMASYYGDTKKARLELHSSLKYKTFKEGIETL